MGQVVHRKGEFNALCTPTGGAVAGVLQPGIEHQCIEWHLVMAELFDRLGHRRKVRQIGNAGVNGTRQSRADSLGPFCIAANNGECITTGQKEQQYSFPKGTDAGGISAAWDFMREHLAVGV